MLFRNRLIGSLGAVLLGLMLGGCSLSGESPQDDEREPHFVLGKSRVNALDYAGAAEAFQEALEVSPRSAAAHYQLAWLYENKLADPAAAIYHYQEYLLLDSKAGNPDVIRQHIYACKQQLVTDVMQLPSAPAAQQQIEKLAEQNRRMQDELDKWHAYYAAQTTARPVANPVPATPGSPGYLPPVGPPATIGITDSPAASTARRSLPGAPANFHPVPVAPIRLRSHTVTAGETMAAIARKAGVSLPALQAANPGVNPKKLRAGQTLNLPPF
jgi:tetratricopeptide (TPR) repeat protein